MAIDEFLKCTNGTYVARRLVARIEVVDDRGATEHVLFDDNGYEIGRAEAHEDDVKATFVPAVGWTHWTTYFDPEDPDEKWERRAEPVIAWRIANRQCKPFGATKGSLDLWNFPVRHVRSFSYLEESREGRKRYWAYKDILSDLFVYQTIGELEAEIKRFISSVRADLAEQAKHD